MPASGQLLCNLEVSAVAMVDKMPFLTKFKRRPETSLDLVKLLSREMTLIDADFKQIAQAGAFPDRLERNIDNF